MLLYFLELPVYPSSLIFVVATCIHDSFSEIHIPECMHARTHAYTQARAHTHGKGERERTLLVFYSINVEMKRLDMVLLCILDSKCIHSSSLHLLTSLQVYFIVMKFLTKKHGIKKTLGERGKLKIKQQTTTLLSSQREIIKYFGYSVHVFIYCKIYCWVYDYWLLHISYLVTVE